ncbi:hypothetical protein DUI87_16946 [Hirundo rustica rustica]|uniref:Uncharacterized protein n=1 Tax=Hirundo rustica rustica TaxID=333673 RepID=A0A3M0K2U2_HIRRU|nr:hypothetical protein DUI87_16946 [Hirundo rustica rustica]
MAAELENKVLLQRTEEAFEEYPKGQGLYLDLLDILSVPVKIQPDIPNAMSQVVIQGFAAHIAIAPREPDRGIRGAQYKHRSEGCLSAKDLTIEVKSLGKQRDTNYLDAGVECTLSKLASDMKLGEGLGYLEGREVLQRELDIPENWAFEVKNSPAERHLGTWVDGKLKMNQECPGSQKDQL